MKVRPNGRQIELEWILAAAAAPWLCGCVIGYAALTLESWLYDGQGLLVAIPFVFAMGGILLSLLVNLALLPRVDRSERLFPIIGLVGVACGVLGSSWILAH